MTICPPDDLAAIRNSRLFDADWYLQEYPDVRRLGVDAAEHYLWLGGRLNRHPSPSFDAAGYLEIYPDVAKQGLNPLLHYLKWGKNERRAIFPVQRSPGPSDAAEINRPGMRPSVPRIVYESHNFKLQGAPSSLFELACGVKLRQRFSATLVSSSMGPIAQLAERHGVECVTHAFSAARITSRRQADEFIDRLACFYRRMQAGLVHVNTLQNFHCVKAAHRAGLPCVWNVRESEDPDTYYDHLEPQVRELAYSAFAEASAVVFVADATRRQWQSRLEGVVETVTITNGIDVDRMMRLVHGTSRAAVRASLDLRDDDILLLTVGTVTERKGQLDLVDAVRRLDKATRQKLVLAFVGFNDSDYSRAVMAQLQDLQAEGLRVIAVPESLSEDERTRVAELYLGADVFVLTSRVESYPRVTLEAMHFGLPIISTPCFGVREQLVEGQGALFYDCGETEKLGQLIVSLCDGERRRALAAAARDRLKQLNSYEAMLDSYEAVYTRLIAADAQSAGARSKLADHRTDQERLMAGLAAVPAVARFHDQQPDVCPYFKPPAKLDPFVAWQLYNAPSRFRNQQIHGAVEQLPAPVTLSVVVPVYNPPLEILEACIASVLSQSYSGFELILVDDKSTDPSVLPFLESLKSKDKRIVVHARHENGHISTATNDGARLARGDYLLFLDNDDALAEHALAIVAAYLSEHSETDIVYSDDAKMEGERTALFGPKFKPDWSPELLLSYCYVSHVKVVRKSLYQQVGGCREGFEGSQDHDLVLRLGEHAKHVGHIPQVLYRRRVLPGSTASSGHAKPYSFEAGRRACQEAFARRKVDCTVVQPDWAVERGYGVFVPRMPDSGPEVSILIPTKNNWKSLDRLLSSLKQTSYSNYVVHIIDNMSDCPETLAYLRRTGLSVMRVPNPDGKFNFAHLNNVAARSVSGEYLLFLNDDIEIREPQWLSQMVGWGRLPGVGVVGARLSFGNGKLQHAGVVTSLPWHIGRTAFRGMEEKNYGYMMLARVTRNCSAVTAACMLTPRRLFNDLGGFDAQRFAIAYNDIDYCIRARNAGHRVVYCGEAELDHHEGTSRGKADAQFEIANYAELHGDEADPFYNPHLSRDTNRFDIKPTVVPPVRAQRPIKVLAFTHNLRLEGAPNSAFELLSGISATGSFEVTVASPTDGPLKERYLRAGIEVRILDAGLSVNHKVKDYHATVDALVAALDFGKFDVVYANTAELFWVVDAAYRSGVPSLWNIRESESWKQYYSRYPEKVAARALQCFSFPYRVVFVAHATRRRWSPVETMGNFDVVHNGIDAKRIGPGQDPAARTAARLRLGLVGDTVMALTVGTTCPRKGQHDLIRALGHIPGSTRERLALYIVGARKGEYLDYLHSLRKLFPADVAERIHLVPETDETRHFWDAADMFVCTSRMESYPRVVLEAMVKGLPIVTTPSFGVTEQVREGANAVFYEPDDVQSLGEHICRLAEDEKLRHKMALANVDLLRSLTSYDKMLAQYMDCLRAAAFSAVPEAAASLEAAPRIAAR